MKKNVKPVAAALASLKAFWSSDTSASSANDEKGAEDFASTETEDSTETEADASTASETETEVQETAAETSESSSTEEAETEVEETSTDASASSSAETNASAKPSAKTVHEPEMVTMPKADFEVISNAAQQWEANEGRFNTLVKWEASMSDAGAGLKGGDASNNSGKQKRVSRTTARAQKIYDKRVNRSGKDKD